VSCNLDRCTCGGSKTGAQAGAVEQRLGQDPVRTRAGGQILNLEVVLSQSLQVCIQLVLSSQAAHTHPHAVDRAVMCYEVAEYRSCLLNKEGFATTLRDDRPVPEMLVHQVELA